jgi:hypothetical protein
MIAELPSLPLEGAALSTVTNPLPADFEELRRAVADIQSVRAELTQLRREKVEAGALQARIDKLTLQVAALSGDSNLHPAKPLSPVSQASVRAQASPEEAARLVAAMPSGQEQDQAALAVIDRWIRTHPDSAAAWTTQFAEGPLREQAMSVVARQWGLRDCKATAGWLETLPLGASRDAAIGSFVESADGYDIKLALEWANQTESPERRAMRVEQTARRWLREDNLAAREWIKQAQLPAGLAERLLSAK